MSSEIRKKLGEILLDSGIITKEQLATSLEGQKNTKKRLGEILVRLDFVTEIDIAQTLSNQLGIPYIEMASAVVEPEAIELIKEKLAKKYIVLPLSVERKFVVVAMADPLDFDAINDLRFATGRDLKPAVSTITEIRNAIQRYYNLAEPLQEVLEKITGGHVEVVSSRIEVSHSMDEALKKSKSPPIIRLVDSMMTHAVRNRASDIHIEPREKVVMIRERVDGFLRNVFKLPKWVQGPVTSRVKIMAMMDIAEKRVPQDGKIKVRMEDKELDLRISTIPTQYGEKIAVRVLDTQAAKLVLEDIGFAKKDYLRTKAITEKHQGIILVTGPTGSGKSSTLYAMINHIKAEEKHIITLEDPVEYEIAGVNQVAINEKTGLTFAYGLRSILRQDPDVIMVGEMRDNETANIAIQASITGHMVLSTLHTNTAIAAITRLRNLEIPSYLIASSLNGIIAQRLVRKLCNKCKRPYSLSSEELITIGLKGKDHAGFKFYRGMGCTACGETGYRGRAGVFEVLIVNSLIKDLIANEATEDTILKAALKTGMRYISEDGIEKVKQGVTSIDELLRILYIDDREEVSVCQCCGKTVRDDFFICPYCGHSILDKCPDCGKKRDVEWEYCPYCQKEFAKNKIPNLS
ncbi:MAG: ATPase, T2SS/T4P/T4SS family [Thermodesulfobacteriota bacterium]